MKRLRQNPITLRPAKIKIAKRVSRIRGTIRRKP